MIRYNGSSWERIDYPNNILNEDITSKKANEKVPKTGYWFTVARENSRQYFKEGEVFPNFKSDCGDVYWQYDGEE